VSRHPIHAVRPSRRAVQAQSSVAVDDESYIDKIIRLNQDLSKEQIRWLREDTTDPQLAKRAINSWKMRKKAARAALTASPTLGVASP
jgi:hypothetical protein